MVYGLGSNYWGSLGLGHNSYVNEIQVIDRLCHKNITQFFNGLDFVLALTQDNCLYVWGNNDKGQLVVSEVNEYKSLFEELHSLGSGAFGEVF
ncbi:unnamed protein product, partial [Oppiella nova]